MSSLMFKLSKPGLAVMNHLSLRVKLLGAFLTLLLPLVLLTAYTTGKVHSELSVAKTELAGVHVSERFMSLIVLTQKQRGLINLHFAGESNQDAISSNQQALQKALTEVQGQVDQHPDWQLDDWRKLQADLSAALSNTSLDGSASFKLYTSLVERLLQFHALIAEQSGLLLDPEANSYFLMDEAIQKIPFWVEQVARLRGAGAGMLRSGNIRIEDKISIADRIGALQTITLQIDSLKEPLQRAGETLPPQQKLAIDQSLQYLHLSRQNLLGEAADITAQNYFAQGSQVIQHCLTLQAALRDRLAEVLQLRTRQLQLWLNAILFISICSTVLTLYLLWVFYFSLISTVHNLNLASQAVSDGDLTRQIHIDGRDEIAQTGLVLESMNHQLSTLVANIRSNASMVTQLADSLSDGINHLSMRTEQQASSLEQTSASVEDLAETVRKNSDSAGAVNQLAERLHRSAEASGSTMQAAVTSMQGIQSGALKVQEIVSMIDSIAFQTNILALNAAVEAARAGEQGRGFAVVASEVRSLAQRSSESAREIRHLIGDSVKQVGQGVQEINHVSQTLAEIVSGIRELAQNMNQIAQASAEQSNGLAQISEALKHLDEITQHNAQMADHAKQTAANLDQRANFLLQGASSFKLRQGTADEAYAMVKAARQLYDQYGMRAHAMVTEDRQKQFSDRDMYVFAFSRDGAYLAFAGNPGKLSVNLLNVAGLDGRQLVSDAFSVPAEGGWISYTIVNPVSRKVEQKTSYVEAVSDDVVIGCGVYKTW